MVFAQLEREMTGERTHRFEIAALSEVLGRRIFERFDVGPGGRAELALNGVSAPLHRRAWDRTVGDAISRLAIASQMAMVTSSP